MQFGGVDESHQYGTSKFLVSHLAAGTIIGKKGCNVSELQNVTGTRIQLSRAAEIYPGTRDRVLCIYGTPSSICKCLQLIFEVLRISSIHYFSNCSTESQKYRNYQEQNVVCNATCITQIQMLVPASVCGAIIGQGGSIIRSLCDELQSKISIGQRPISSTSNFNVDRILNITSDGPNKLSEAVRRLLQLTFVRCNQQQEALQTIRMQELDQLQVAYEFALKRLVQPQDNVMQAQNQTYSNTLLEQLIQQNAQEGLGSNVQGVLQLPEQPLLNSGQNLLPLVGGQQAQVSEIPSCFQSEAAKLGYLNAAMPIDPSNIQESAFNKMLQNGLSVAVNNATLNPGFVQIQDQTPTSCNSQQTYNQSPACDKLNGKGFNVPQITPIHSQEHSLQQIWC